MKNIINEFLLLTGIFFGIINNKIKAIKIERDLKKYILETLAFCIDKELVDATKYVLNEEQQKTIILKNYLPAIKAMIIRQDFIFTSIQVLIAELNIQEFDELMSVRYKGYSRIAQKIVFENLKNNKDERDFDEIVLDIDSEVKLEKTLLEKIDKIRRREGYFFKNFLNRTIFDFFFIVAFVVSLYENIWIVTGLQIIVGIVYYRYSLSIINCKKDNLQSLARFCFFETDQYRMVERGDIEAIKTMISKRKIKSIVQIQIAKLGNLELDEMMIYSKRGYCPQAFEIITKL